MSVALPRLGAALLFGRSPENSADDFSHFVAQAMNTLQKECACDLLKDNLGQPRGKPVHQSFGLRAPMWLFTSNADTAAPSRRVRLGT